MKKRITLIAVAALALAIQVGGASAQTTWDTINPAPAAGAEVLPGWGPGTIVDAYSGNRDFSNPWCNNRNPGNAFGYFCNQDGITLTPQNGVRNFLWDPDVIAPQDGIPEYGPYRMMVFDLATLKRGMRLYTAIDHWNGSPQSFVDNEFVTQDVMEYSVWGYVGPDADATPSVADATVMTNWKLLSDVVGFENSQATITADGHPAFTFDGDDGPDAAAPVTVYTTGSNLGIVNAYTRDYVFCDAYKYVGVRASAISKDATLSATRPGVLGYAAGKFGDADPELDAVYGFEPEQSCAGADIVKTLTFGEDTVGIYKEESTAFSFEITYTAGATDDNLVITDTVRAEYQITNANANNELSPTHGTATFNQDNTQSASEIEWFIMANTDCSVGCTLEVDIETVENMGKGHGKKNQVVFKPTSCGPLPINDGATAFKDLVTVGTYEPLVDIEIVAGISNPLLIEAVGYPDDVLATKPCEVPKTVFNVQVTQGVDDSGDLTVTWDANGDQALEGYRIYRDGVEVNDQPVATSLLTYTDGGLTTGTNYCYTVVAYNPVGESIDSKRVTQTECANAP